MSSNTAIAPDKKRSRQIQRLKREAARVARQIWGPPKEPMMDPESVRRLAARNTELAADVQRGHEIIAHLRRVEVAYLEARDALDQREAALELANHEVEAVRETGQLQRAELEAALEVANLELKAARDKGHHLNAELETARGERRLS